MHTLVRTCVTVLLQLRLYCILECTLHCVLYTIHNNLHTYMIECATLKKNKENLEHNVEVHSYNACKKMAIHVRFCNTDVFTKIKKCSIYGN